MVPVEDKFKNKDQDILGLKALKNEFREPEEISVENHELSSAPDLIEPILGNTIRFTILMILSNHSRVKFADVLKLLKISPGNLDHHAKMLEKAGFIIKKKAFSVRRAVTIFQITPSGKMEIEQYAAKLHSFIEDNFPGSFSL